MENKKTKQNKSNETDFSGLYEGDCHGVSFGVHFSDRNANIDEIYPEHLNSFVGNNHQETVPSTSKASSYEHQWPVNENTYMIGDIKTWPDYRPKTKGSLNFTELIEKNTIVHQTQMPDIAIPNTGVNVARFRDEDIICLDDSPQKEIASATYTVNLDGSLKSVAQPRAVLKDITSEVKLNVHRVENFSVKTPQATKKANYYAAHNEFTYNDGEFPVKTNQSILSWPCVSLLKTVTKSFRIRNTGNKWISIQVVVEAKEFEITSLGESGRIILHENETRQIDVTFSPTDSGIKTGKIIFTPASKWPNETARSIHLFGYGGTSILKLRHVEPSLNNEASVRLEVDESDPTSDITLKGYFKISNSSPVDGAVIMWVKEKMHVDHMFLLDKSQIFIQPKKCIINRNDANVIQIYCQLRRQDLQHSDLEFIEDDEDITIGMIDILFGSEPDRQRIVQFLQQNSGDLSSKKNYGILRSGFPDTITELHLFRDGIQDVKEMSTKFLKSEIKLVIKRSCLHDASNSTAFVTCTDECHFLGSNRL